MRRHPRPDGNIGPKCLGMNRLGAKATCIAAAGIQLLGALQVPFGEPTASQYIPVRFTIPRKCDLLERTETYRDILHGSEKPEDDADRPAGRSVGSLPSANCCWRIGAVPDYENPAQGGALVRWQTG